MSDLIKQCDECKLNECINCEHSWTDIQELKQQLAEKDKEIEKLNLMIKTLPNHDTEIEQQIRHQVCEEIKKYLLKNWDWFKDLWLINGKCEELEQVLDQIEKGENK